MYLLYFCLCKDIQLLFSENEIGKAYMLHYHYNLTSYFLPFILLSSCYEVNCVPPNSYIEAITSKVTIFVGRAFRKAVTDKLGHKCEPLSDRIGVFIRWGRDTREKRNLTRNQPQGHCDLGFLASNTVRK